MGLLDDLVSMGGGGAVQQLAQQFGLNESQATSAIGALLPALQGGMKTQMGQPGGLDSLVASLSGGGFDRFAQEPSALGAAETTGMGNDILGQLLGSKDASRQVASQAAEQTGIGADVLKQMLPVVATMLMGGLSQKAGGSQAMASMGSSPGQGGDLMSSLTSMLDADKDGSAVDDILGMAQKFLQK
jgi:hypothetical protein